MARVGRVLVGLAARWQKFRQEKRTSIKVFCFACICLLLGLLWNHKNLLFAPTETDDNYGMITISKGSVGGDTPRIIIVGAGAAGLTAAKTFKQHGYNNVRILESSKVFGGRARRTNTFADYPIDLGPSWLHHPSWLPIINGGDVDVPHITFRDSKGKNSGYFFTGNYSWYDFIANHMAPDPESIVYGCQVDRIKYDDSEGKSSEVQVKCGKRTFVADKVIVTASLAVLKDGDITFEPTLPNKIIDAHPAIMMGGIKIIIEFQQRFYPEFLLISEYCNNCGTNDRGDIEFWDYSAVYNSSRSVLAGYFVGKAANSLIHQSDKSIINDTLKWLDNKLGGNYAQKYYKKHLIVNWSKEPFVPGVYSTRRPHFPSNGPQNVDGKIYLAGEAFPYRGQPNGWVHSAALSGKQAAVSVIGLETSEPTMESTWKPTAEPTLAQAM